MVKFEGKNIFKKLITRGRRAAAKIKNVGTQANAEVDIDGESYEFIDCPSATNLKSGRTYVNLNACAEKKKIIKDNPE